MSSSVQPTCPHGLRPGTTVCLHCRHEARLAARKRRYQLAARLGLGVAAVGVVVALIVGGVMSISPNGEMFTRVDQSVSGAVEQPAAQASETKAPAPSRATGTKSVSGSTAQTSPAAPGPGAPAPAAPSAQTLAPNIPEGRRELGDSMYAVRDGAQVTVHFDTETLRTRLDWKFENVVRATLPAVFGSAIRTAFDSIATGSWAKGGDLLAELPSRGIALRVGDQSLRVFPITRPRRDGPIVVAYRALAER